MRMIEECEGCGRLFDYACHENFNDFVKVKLTTSSGQKCSVLHYLEFDSYCFQCLEDRESEIISCLCDGKFVIDPS